MSSRYDRRLLFGSGQRLAWERHIPHHGKPLCGRTAKGNTPWQVDDESTLAAAEKDGYLCTRCLKRYQAEMAAWTLRKLAGHNED